MTSEQRAIDAYLANPKLSPTACGCVGPQPIDRNKKVCRDEYTITISAFKNRLETLEILRDVLKIDFFLALNVIEGETTPIDWLINLDKLTSALDSAGTTYTILKNTGPSNLFPVCPCAMDYVSVVDGIFYQIGETDSPTGITYTAKSLGPVGGPYDI